MTDQRGEGTEDEIPDFNNDVVPAFKKSHLTLPKDRIRAEITKSFHDDWKPPTSSFDAKELLKFVDSLDENQLAMVELIASNGCFEEYLQLDRQKQAETKQNLPVVIMSVFLEFDCPIPMLLDCWAIMDRGKIPCDPNDKSLCKTNLKLFYRDEDANDCCVFLNIVAAFESLGYSLICHETHVTPRRFVFEYRPEARAIRTLIESFDVLERSFYYNGIPYEIPEYWTLEEEWNWPRWHEYKISKIEWTMSDFVTLTFEMSASEIISKGKCSLVLPMQSLLAKIHKHSSLDDISIEKDDILHIRFHVYVDSVQDKRDYLVGHYLLPDCCPKNGRILTRKKAAEFIGLEFAKEYAMVNYLQKYFVTRVMMVGVSEAVCYIQCMKIK
jgi:hypothetical protein